MAANVAIAIGRILLAAAPYAVKAAQAKEQGKRVPDVSGSLKENKDRWLQCTIHNTTEFPIAANSSYFDSGRYEDNPGFVDSFSLGVFTACEGDNTFMTGVSGGQAFQIDVDGDHTFQFAIGFTNPYAGSFKAGIVASSKAEEGYNNAKQEGGSIESPWYEGKDEDGNAIKFKFHISATASQRPQFVISEIRF